MLKGERSSAALLWGWALEDLMSDQPLFQVTNHHAESCGAPPQIDEQTFPGVYRSYFEKTKENDTIRLCTEHIML